MGGEENFTKRQVFLCYTRLIHPMLKKMKAEKICRWNMCSFTIHSSNQGMRTLSSPKLKKKDFSPVICRAFSARLLVGTPRPGPPSQRGGRNQTLNFAAKTGDYCPRILKGTKQARVRNLRGIVVSLFVSHDEAARSAARMTQPRPPPP